MGDQEAGDKPYTSITLRRETKLLLERLREHPRDTWDDILTRTYQRVAASE
jgi:hypothetical protein